jgi:hypothetical protein
MRYLLLGVALSALAACAAPNQGPSEPALLAQEKIESIDDFLAHQDYLRAGLQDGSIGDLSARELEEVIDRQDELRALLGDVETIGELSEEDKIRVLNAQNTINGILSRALADAPICRRETVVGSLRPRTVCMTPRQRERLRDNSRESLRYLQNGFMPRKN